MELKFWEETYSTESQSIKCKLRYRNYKIKK